MKNTGDLMNELKSGKESLDDFLENSEDSFINPDIKAFWTEIVDNSTRSKSDIINKSDFNYKYFYDVINGRKIPKRDKVIKLCLAMKVGIDKCQEALKISGKSQLYPRIRRDSIILYALKNEWSIFRCSAILKRYGEDVLK